MHPGIYLILVPLLESPRIALPFQYTPGKSLEKAIHPEHFKYSSLSSWWLRSNK